MKKRKKSKFIEDGAKKIDSIYYDGQLLKLLDSVQSNLFTGQSSNSGGSTIVYKKYARRVTWQDVLMDYGIAKVGTKWAGKHIWSLLITLGCWILRAKRSGV